MKTCNQDDNNPTSKRDNGWDGRLGKRLAYILRYGAEKEGLHVHEGGYVDFLQLVKVPLLRHHQPHEVLEEIAKSTGSRGELRFEKKYHRGDILVRANYGRNMERNPCHFGSQVSRLMEKCMDVICTNILDYDLQDFPDEFLLNDMIHRLKRQRRLSNQALRCILGPNLQHLNLEGAYLTEASIKLVRLRCPHLRMLSLKGCGYVMTDHFMEILLKKMDRLESLNLAGCNHLTDRTIRAICKNVSSSLLSLYVSGVPQLSESAILDLVLCCSKLKHLDVYGNRNLSDKGRETLIEIGQERDLTVVCEGPQGLT